MFKRMSIFIENHAILSTCQFGFREHHSTPMALTKLVDKITHELDKKTLLFWYLFKFIKSL